METKTLEEILKENKERRRKFIQQEMKKKKQEEVKETILALFIGTFIVAISLVLLNNLGKKEMNDCMSAGHSQMYCERGLK